MSYGSAMSGAESICGIGWHWCRLADFGGPGEPAVPTCAGASTCPPGSCAWLDFETTGCTSYVSDYRLTTCAPAAFNLSAFAQGTAACWKTGGCPAGFRVAAWLDEWNVWSVKDGTCHAHVSLQCGGLASGDAAPVFCWVACCRD